MNLSPTISANHGCSRLTGGASLQQGGSNFNVRHMRGDNIKLRAKRARLQQTNHMSKVLVHIYTWSKPYNIGCKQEDFLSVFFAVI